MPARTVKIEPPKRDVIVDTYVVEVGKGVGITLRHFFKNFLARVPWLVLGILAFVAALVGVGTVLVMKAASPSMQNAPAFFVVFGGVPAGLGALALVAHSVRRFRRRPADNYLRLIPYPDVPADYYAPRFRGEHRLMQRPDGTVRCVSCMMCATVCPADCIHIVAGEADTPLAGKDPKAPKAQAEKYPVHFEIDELRCVVCGFCVEACPCDAIRMDSGKHVTAHPHRRDFVFDRNRLLAGGGPSEAVQGGEGPGWRSRELPPGHRKA